MSISCINKFSPNVFKDKRLFYRCNKILQSCLENPDSSIPELFNDYHQAKATYRFLSNDNIVWDKLLQDCTKQLARQIKISNETILVAQDTTDLDFTSKPKIKDLGYLEKENQYGIKSHTALGITTSGEPLGLLSQINWTRDLNTYGKKKDRTKKPIEEKESFRWLKTFKNLQKLKLKKFVLIGDRESDISELFNLPREANQHLLVRSSINRRTNQTKEKGIKLWESLNQKKVYQQKIEIPRSRKQPARVANCYLQFGKTSIIQKQIKFKGETIKEKNESEIYLVTLKEIDCPQDSQPIEWKLITTIPVNSKKNALTVIQYYKFRWLVEEFHYILKSGCRIEELQLKAKERILNMLMVYNLVACKILNLTYAARINSKEQATNHFSKTECEVLYNYYKLKPPQNKPLSILKAVILVAKLGGFMARKSDGFPGAKTIWKGLIKLSTMTEYHLVLVGKG